jgi:hypothetical protein
MIDAEQLIAEFRAVAQIAGLSLSESDLVAEIHPAPHQPPRNLPDGKTAVYVYCTSERCLKVGKAGPKSKARYTSQHYQPDSAPSTLARSLLGAKTEFSLPDSIDSSNIGEWIKQNTYRVNILLNAATGANALNLLEAFVQCKLDPRFEGFASQRSVKPNANKTVA